MSADYRQEAVAYYDKFSEPPPGDVDFYRARVTTRTRVLELGCGTGRVLVPLAGAAGYVQGLDHSPAMLAVCREKLAGAGIDERRARVEVADITDFDLTGRMPRFDLITAPFRVMQNLETDAQVLGLMRCIARHLAPGGEAILNTFRPRGPAAELKARWDARDGIAHGWARPDGSDTVWITENCTRHRDNPLIVYPVITYRRHDAAGAPIDEARLEIAMRVWFPDELLELVRGHGFETTGLFGGYDGEAWGEGSELVVAFRRAD